MSSKLTILHVGDIHATAANLDIIKPALEAIEQIAAERNPRFVVIPGDLTHYRGRIEPAAAVELRSFIGCLTTRAAGVVIVSGNHDQDNAGGPGNIAGIFNDEYGAVSDDALGTIETFERPGITPLYGRGVGLQDCALLCLPSYSKYLYSGDGDISADLSAYIQGMVAKARAEHPGVPILAAWHGTICGGICDNEQEMPAGVDVQLPASAFAGVSLVMANHLHRAQEHALPDGRLVYAGAVAPLTFGDRWEEPRVCWYEIGPSGVEGFESIPLPVASRMVRVDVASNGDGLTPLEAIAGALVDRYGKESFEDARLRIVLRGTGAWLQGAADVADLLTKRLRLRECKLIPERTDRVMARVDVSREHMDLGRVLGKWCELTAPDQADAVYQVHQEIEGECAGKLGDRDYQMRPLALTVKNYKCWQDAAVDYAELGDITCIIGDYNSGKSNLFGEALAIALYGRGAKDVTLADMIGPWGDRAVVALEYESNGATWRVERTIKAATLKGRAIGRMDTRLWRDGEVRNAEDARATQQVINDTCGPWEFHRAVRYAGQDDGKAVLQATLADDPMHLRNQLAGMVLVDFDGRAEAGKARLRAVEAEQQRTAGELAAAKRDAEAGEEAAAALTAAEASLALARVEVESLEAALHNAQSVDLARAREAVAAARERRAQIQGELVAQGDPEAAVRDREQELTAAKRRRDAAQASADLAARGLDVAGAPVAPSPEAVAAAKVRAATAAQRVAEAETRAQSAWITLDRAEFVVAQEARALEDGRARAAMLKQMPCHGEEWHQYGGEVVLESSECPALGEAARVDLQALASAVTEANDGRAIAAKDNIEASESLSTAKVAAAATAADYQSLLDQERKAQGVAVLRERAANAAKALAEAEQAAERATENVAKARGEAEASRAKLASLRAGLQDADAWLARAKSAEHVVAERVAGMESCLSAARRSVTAGERVIGASRERVAAAERARERLTVLAGVGSKLSSEATVLGLYVRAMGRMGVPYLLVEQLVPELVERVNACLSPTDIRYRVETVKASANGERDRLVQLYSDHRGEHPAAEASGHVGGLLGASLRWALAELGAWVNGGKVDHFVQDEGLSTATGDGLSYWGQMFRAFVARTGGRLQYITHEAALVGAADVVVRVVPGADGSKVEMDAEEMAA